MLPIGLIGSGTEWESVWRPALTASARLAVSSFYDPVACRGERIAEQLEWPAVKGLRRVLDTPRLRGVVILDSGWHSSWVVDQCDARRLPVLVAPRDVGVDALAAALPRISGESLVQPEFRRRYTAASMRLRELTATRLGPITSLLVEVPSPVPLTSASLVEVIDWCRFVVQSAPLSIDLRPARDEFHVAFRKLVNDRPLTAVIRWHETTDEARPLFPNDFSAEVVCRDGSAFITGSRHLRWNADGESADEQLADDRPSASVQLDLFARRLSGGLVPVPSLEDVTTALELARVAVA